MNINNASTGTFTSVASIVSIAKFWRNYVASVSYVPMCIKRFCCERKHGSQESRFKIFQSIYVIECVLVNDEFQTQDLKSFNWIDQHTLSTSKMKLCQLMPSSELNWIIESHSIAG